MMSEPSPVEKGNAKLIPTSSGDHVDNDNIVVMQSSSILAPDPTPTVTPTGKMRSGTKPGCLTCRERGISCGKERLTCVNCVKSKRQCVGYNQHKVLKLPVDEWPHDPNVVSTTDYHTPISKRQSSSSNGTFQYRDKFKPPETVKEAQVSLGQAQNDDRVELWRHGAAPAAEENKRVIQRLCVSCLDTLKVLAEESKCSPREVNSLQRCQGNLQLWAHQHQVHNGALDATLQRSTGIWQTMLELLIPLCKVLLQGLLGADMQRNFNTGIRGQYKSGFRVYQEYKWLISDNRESCDSDSENSDSDTQLWPVKIELALRKIRFYTECLTDLGSSLDCPAWDDPEDEKQSFANVAQRSAEDYLTERLRAKFPLAELDMLQCLGRASWERYQRMQQRRELNAQQQVQSIPDGKSCAVNSEFVDSGVGTSIPAAPSTYASSIASLMSSMTGGKRVQIPPLSAEAKSGAPFDCIACGGRVRCVNDHDWRKHLFADLQPYSCFFADCSFSTTPFQDRKTWIIHLELQHGFGPNWEGLKCPFCVENIDEGIKAIVGHLSRHMEDIATAAMPQDIDSDDKSDKELVPGEPSLDEKVQHGSSYIANDCNGSSGLDRAELDDVKAPKIASRLSWETLSEPGESMALNIREGDVSAAADAEAKKISGEKKAAVEAAVLLLEHAKRVREETEKKAAADAEITEKAYEKALAEAKMKAPIKFQDAVGRKYSFPWYLCMTWKGMEDLINQAFSHVDIIGPHVQQGHYDLEGPHKEIILPQVWEAIVQPGWSIIMRMWPMPKPLAEEGLTSPDQRLFTAALPPEKYGKSGKKPNALAEPPVIKVPRMPPRLGSPPLPYDSRFFSSYKAEKKPAPGGFFAWAAGGNARSARRKVSQPAPSVLYRDPLLNAEESRVEIVGTAHQDDEATAPCTATFGERPIGMMKLPIPGIAGVPWVVGNNPEELKSRENMTLVRKQAMRTYLERTSSPTPREPKGQPPPEEI